MPFKSGKQRRYLWANEPKVAKKFAKDTPKKTAKRRGGSSGKRRA
jgi:hypothetical protein